MINVKLIRKKSGNRSLGGSTGGNRYTGGTRSTDYAAEAGHAREADHSENADNATLAAEATHAASSADIDAGSSIWTTIQEWIAKLRNDCLMMFLRKDTDDIVAGLITFAKGLVSKAKAVFQGDVEVDKNLDVKSDISVGPAGTYGITKDGIATLAGAVAEYLRSNDFRQGYLAGQGYGIYKDTAGHSVVETDSLIVRMRAVFAELEIRKLSYVGGDQVKSFAGSTIVKVVALDADGNETASSDPAAYKCYFLDDDGTTRTENWWKVGDQARCQTFNIESGVHDGVSNRYFWRLVTAVGSEDVSIGGSTKHMGFVVLSNTATGQTIKGSDGNNIKDDNGNDIVFVGYDSSIANDAPAADDKIVQLGSQSDASRSYAVIDFISEQRTSYYYGINGYSLSDHEVMRLSPKGSWVYTKNFEMRVGSPAEWHPQTDYKGTWDTETSYTYYNTVTSDGLFWMHNKRGYVSKGDEPSIYSDVWTLVSGGGDLKIVFYGTTGVVSSRGCDITIEAHLTMAGRDITDMMLSNPLNVMSWTRDSGIASEDKAWSPTTGATANILAVSHHNDGPRADLGSSWRQRHSTSFTFTVILKNTLGTESQPLSATIPIER